MELERHEVLQDDKRVDLTVKEYGLLRVLLENAGKVVRREQLIEQVWDTTWFGSTKTVDVHVSALRRKLGDDPASPRYIHTVRGVGFRFAAPAELNMTFRTRLLLAAFYVLTAVVIALAVPLGLTVEKRTSSDFETAVLGDAAVLAARVADLVPANAAERRAIRALVGESIGARTERVVVTDAAGRVVVDSAGLARAGVPYASAARPELREALFRGRIDTRRRFSDSLGEELLLVTMPVVDQGRVVGAVRVSAGTAGIAADVRESWLRLALLGLVVVGSGLVLAWLLARPLVRQIDSLGDAAVRLGRGEGGARAPEEGPAELAELARSFDDIAAGVERGCSSPSAGSSRTRRTGSARSLTGLRLRLETVARGGRYDAERVRGREPAEARTRRAWRRSSTGLLALAQTAEPQTDGGHRRRHGAAVDAASARWAARLPRRRDGASWSRRTATARAAPSGTTSTIALDNLHRPRSLGTAAGDERCAVEADTGAARRRVRRGRRRGPRARDEERSACLRAVLPGRGRAGGALRHGPRARDRRHARAALGRKRGARRWPWHADRGLAPRATES